MCCIQPELLHIIPVVFHVHEPRSPEIQRTKRDHIINIGKIELQKRQPRFPFCNGQHPEIHLRPEIRPEKILPEYIQDSEHLCIRHRRPVIIQVERRLEMIIRDETAVVQLHLHFDLSISRHPHQDTWHEKDPNPVM